jgi:hypothetical protein
MQSNCVQSHNLWKTVVLIRHIIINAKRRNNMNTRVLYIPIIMLISIFSMNLYADFQPPLPEPGNATIDGDPSEWNLEDDFFANMYEAGNPSKDLLSKCYLRYDCDTHVLYVLVLVEPGVSADHSADDAWVKIYDISNSPQVDGNSSSFAWLQNNQGYEASFPLSEKDYDEIEIHLNVTFDGESGRTSSTGKKSDRIPIEVNCGALPVELTSFNVNIYENSISLNWETATEVNNYGFEIQRSSEKNEWRNVGFVQGHGNSNSPKHYSFSDNSIEASGQYYYRLKQLDIDGQYEYSDVLNVIVEVPMKYSLDQNYPNPFNPATTISYTIPIASSVKLIVYNVFGEEITRLVDETKEAGQYRVEFNAENLASGMYFYSIETKYYKATRKLILLK